MVSNSSKALPYISLGIGLLMAIFSIQGYSDEIEKVVAFLGVVLPITAGGGLINKAIEASVEKKKFLLEGGHLEEVVKKILEQSKKE